MSKEDIKYISGGIELLDEIQPLWEKLNQHHEKISPHFSHEFRDYGFSARKARLLQKYADGHLRIDIAQSQEYKVGYIISAMMGAGVGEIESIFVENDFRGQAIGDELMRRALDWLDEQDVHTKVIDVAVGNERAYTFYARFGFFPRVMALKQRLKGEG